MKFTEVLFIAILFLIFTTSLNAQKIKSENLFYYVNDKESFQSFKDNIKNISIVSPSAYTITENGSIYGSVDQRMLELAKDNNVKVMPLVVNIGEKGFDGMLMHKILENVTARKRSIELMILLAKKNNFNGWQFDIENLKIEDREMFTQYYSEVAKALHEKGLQISAAVVHQISPFPGPNSYHNFLFEDWRAGYDLKAMAEVGDFLSVMTYSQHTRRTPPGPVAGFNWVEDVIKFFLETDVPPSKLSLGFPFYSIHWFADYNNEKGGFSTANSIDYSTTIDMIERYSAKVNWDESAKCNYAIWNDSGVYEYIFIEDAKSFGAKLDFLSKYKLRGISVWRLGQEDTAVWNIVEKNLEPIK
jgi:spore germination protein YaaH